MTNRWPNVITLLLFLVAVPPRVFLWGLSADSGCSPRTAALVAGALALLPLLLLPLAWRGKGWPFGGG